MSSQQQRIRDLLTQGSLDELRRLVGSVPLDEVLLSDCRSVMKGLTPDQRFHLWHELSRKSDRLAGILAVAELRMPPRDVFQAGPLRQGDAMSENDVARAFILKTRTAEGVTGKLPGMFYPEVARLSAVDRVLTLAAAHIGCSPSSDKQINLFSLCCALNRHDANRATHKRTTCALFMRSVLVAAGDGRFNGSMVQLQDSTDMLGAMGLHHVGPKIESSEWISTLKPLSSSAVPNPGDLYYVITPSAIGRGMKTGLGDSGHVGIVVKASRASTQIAMETIDGGQGTDGLGTTRTLSRNFQQNGAGEWEMKSHSQVNGEWRILVGWVDLASVIQKFQSNMAYGIDGRGFATTL